MFTYTEIVEQQSIGSLSISSRYTVPLSSLTLYNALAKPIVISTKQHHMNNMELCIASEILNSQISFLIT